MKRVVQNIAETIENTPLIRINRVAGSGDGVVLGKVEARNLTFSVKGRTAAALICDAEKRGVLKSGMEIVEPTSGNTGIALATIAAARGYSLTLVMPDSMSVERRKVLLASGAQLILTPAEAGMEGAIQKAKAIVASNPARYFMPDQFRNPANPAIHETTTGPEIWRDTDGAVDVVISAVGTGGTLTGVSRHLKRTVGKAIVSVAVEPKESPVLTQHRAGQPLRPGPHWIQGIGAGFVPDVLDLSLVDRIETVSSEEAVEFTKRLAREEGLFCGISSGAAVAATNRLRRGGEFLGKTVVVILPDAGERYLSMAVFEESLEILRRRQEERG